MNPTQPIPQVIPSATHQAPQPIHRYESNPFYAASNGMIRMLQHNLKSSLLSSFFIIVLFIFAYIFSYFLVLLPVIGAIIAFCAFVIGAAIGSGVFFALAAATTQKQTITTSEAFNRSIAKFAALIVLGFVSMLVIGLGFVLLVVPGIYLAGRFSLSGLLVFTENLGPFAAIKRSFALSKGHVFELLGALIAGSMFSGGFLSFVTSVAPLAARYEDLLAIEKAQAPKPKTHWLNYLLTLLVCGFFFIGIAAMLIVSTIVGVKNAAERDKDPFSNSQQLYQNDFQEFSE